MLRTRYPPRCGHDLSGEQTPLSTVIEGRGAQDMVALVLRRRSARFAHRTLYRRKQEGDMLTSTKSGAPEKDRNASVSAAESRVVPHDQTWARSEPTTKAGMASCIGSDSSIVGNIECKGPAQVFGRIEGEVRASDLQIRDGAQVEGSVIAQNVTVCGHVKGTIRAVRVKLQNGGAVEGDIFIGRCRSTRTLSLMDRRDGLRIRRTHRRASTPKARRRRACPQLRYRPLMPSWRMGRSTRLNTDFATQADVAALLSNRPIGGRLSFERRRDFNPPDLGAAQRTL